MIVDHHTLEETNKIGGTEKERKSGKTEADRLHTMLLGKVKKEQPSYMIKMERKKTDFTKIMS